MNVLGSAAAVAALGMFQGQSDIGTVVPPGTAHYGATDQTYTLTSAGANTWYHVDDFHYVWKKASGNTVITADVSFPPPAYTHEPNPHRKGILMFRQTLDAGGVYVAASVHGSGMTALQYRRERGANTEDIELNIEAPKTIRLEKHGDVFTLFLSMKGEALHQVGAGIVLHLREPFYVGIGAVSHDPDTTDKVVFSKVDLQPWQADPASKPQLYSTLQTLQTEDQFRRAMVIRTIPGYMQSPNWAPGGKDIYVHEEGRITRIPVLTPAAGGTPQAVSTGKLVDCSGNFGMSPDGKSMAVSCAQTKGGQHDVYLLPGERKITAGPVSSYFHAWAPDSQTVAFTRGKASKADIFTVSINGGAETRLTGDTLNDGPDYSPDGQFIYFDSLRSGKLQIWRMKPDGSAAEQLTDDANSNSSPHVSPDGKTIAFLSQPRDTSGGPVASLGSSPASLKVMALHDGLIRTVVEFHGDRGSFQMYGWGDANHLAFVSYQTLPAAVSER